MVRQEELRRELSEVVLKAIGAFASGRNDVALVDVLAALGMAGASDTLLTINASLPNADAITRGVLVMSFDDALWAGRDTQAAAREASGIAVSPTA